MKRTVFQRVLCLALSVTVLLGMFGVSTLAAPGTKTEIDVQAPLQQMESFLKASDYASYISKYHPTNQDGTPVEPNPFLPSTTTPIEIPVTEFQQDVSNAEIVVDSDDCQASYADSPANWENFGDFNTVGSSSVYLPASGSTTWKFKVYAPGLYHIVIEYYDCNTGESTISSIERKLFVDGNVPFTESNNLQLKKNWQYDNTDVYTLEEYKGVFKAKYGRDLRELQNGFDYELVDLKENGASLRFYVYDEAGVKMIRVTELTQDINGNSMSPDAVQTPSWNTYYASDSTGYTAGYFEYYFSAASAGGEEHTITLESEREPMIVRAIRLEPVDQSGRSIPSYEEVKAYYQAQNYGAGTGSIRLEAEFPDLVSDASVSATNDNTSNMTYPISPKAQLYNVIGENSYSSIGQWAAYKFTVSSSGLYKIGMRYMQNTLQGMFICRSLKLSGGAYGLSDGTPTLPFAEAEAARFNFSDEWQSTFVGDGHEVFEFYFEEGVEYTLYLECSLGSLQSLISEAELALENINAAYLRILQLTGADPDQYKDYRFEVVMPDVLDTLLAEGIRLCNIASAFEALCGDDTGSHIAILYNIARLLERIGSDDGYEIGRNLANLKSNLGTLGTWINDSKRSSMMVDVIYILPENATEENLPKAKAGFFSSLWFEICSFFNSFFTDYDVMGLTKVPDEDAPVIDVWLATGRDQSKIWRSMIDIEGEGGFTSNTGVAVTLKLVTAPTLLPSILAGKGPDVYLGLTSTDVINYAIRSAVIGVSGNDERLGVDETGADRNKAFTSYYYTYYNEQTRTFETTTTEDSSRTPTFVSKPYDKVATAYDPTTGEGNYVQAALDTLRLSSAAGDNVSFGLPMTMAFPMMFYRADILAELGRPVPETWADLLALLPDLQANNMEIGVAYESAINVLLYQMGGNMWRYTDDPTGKYAGARIGLDTDVAYEAFDYVCKLYTEHSFPVTFDAANRFRTGEMPILVGDYAGIYNQLIVFATEINGLWEFCSLPGWEREDAETGTKIFNYDSLATVGATVLLYGGKDQTAEDILHAWMFMQWNSDADRQSDYGNKMVALIGPSAKYETANIQAIKNLSWSATEQKAIADQINHMSSIVNYPGSYIIARYTKFAFLEAKNDGAKPVDALRNYIDAINTEIKRKRDEFGLPSLEPGAVPDYVTQNN